MRMWRVTGEVSRESDKQQSATLQGTCLEEAAPTPALKELASRRTGLVWQHWTPRQKAVLLF